ncbi:hypothetical protein [Georgenia subflava]|uniref:VCBS repeat-containing protein n=1 Tax=Georgenia subflava TaxID=1622177 RepID=A0A6N7EEX3_9MICO|nr:hypothetical protein [Georgenia subflava]MPV36982.1 hypothetical protein [Georgenia subflava]
MSPTHDPARDRAFLHRPSHDRSSGSIRASLIVRTGLAAIAGASLLLVGAAVPSHAAPSVQPGTYTGSDSDDNRPSLQVSADGKVVDFTITVFPSCAPEGVTATLGAPLPIADDGSFTADVTHNLDVDGQTVVAVSELEGEVTADGIAEGQYSFELPDHACGDMAYFWLRNEATRATEPPRPTGPVAVAPGTYRDGSGGTLTVVNGRITEFARSYSWFCGLSYAGIRPGTFESVAIGADGSFSAQQPDGAGGTDTLRGQFHHDGSVWGSVDHTNAGSFCAGGTGFTMNRPGGGSTVPPAPQQHGFFLNDSWTAKANHVFHYGRFADEVLMGDWDGDGDDTVLLRRGRQFFVNNALAGGNAEKVITYGRPDDVVVVGDFDGDGVDGIAVRRGAEYHVLNDMNRLSGPADQVVVYGRPGDQVVVGDWDGDGKDTFAVRRGAQYFVKNTIAPGAADAVVVYGRPADITLAGDWDGDGKDTFAVRRGSQYFVKNTIAPGKADREVTYGRAGDEVYVGDWDGDGEDSLGVRRAP